MSSLLTVDRRNPLARGHRLNRGLRSWYLALPGTGGGYEFADLTTNSPGIVTADTPGFAHYAAWTNPGFPGVDSAVAFNPTPDHSDTTFVSAGSQSWLNGATTGFTAHCRFSPTEFNGDYNERGLVSRWGSSFQFLLELRGTDLYAAVQTTGGLKIVPSSGVTLGVGEDHTAALTLDAAGNILLYLDGKYVGNKSTSGALFDVSDLDVRIGARNDGGFFSGLIMEASLYDRAVSPEEMFELEFSCRSGHPGRLNRPGERFKPFGTAVLPPSFHPAFAVANFQNTVGVS